MSSPSIKKDTTTLNDTIDETRHNRNNPPDETETEHQPSKVSSLWSIVDERRRAESLLLMISSADPDETGRAFKSWKRGSRSFRWGRRSNIRTSAISEPDATSTQPVSLTAGSPTEMSS